MSLRNKLSIYIFFVLSLLLGLFLEENSSGGGKFDFNYLFPFIDKISLDFKKGLTAFLLDTGSLIHSPVFSIIIAPFYKLLGNVFLLKISYLLLCSSIPYLFYLILKNKYYLNDKKFLFLLSLIIFLSPYFRSSAIWLLGDNLSILFFGLSIFYFNKTTTNENELKYYYLTFLFLILCCYIRYYYCIFSIFYLFMFYKKLSFKKFVNLLIFSSILSIPALIYFYYIFYNYSFFDKISSYGNLNYYRNTLIVSSILLFYLTPFIIFYIKKIFDHFKKKKNKFIILIFLICLIWLIDFFFIKSLDNFSLKGGGVFVKLCKILSLDESIFLSILFVIFILIIDFYFKKNRLFNYSLILILILSFPIFTIYQKYFDPLFYFIFFGLVNLKDKFTIVDQKKKLLFVYSYFSFFYVFSLFYYN